MAGFFGLFDFTKPGKGVDKDAPEKHPFFLFWELIWRKLSRLITVNAIYFVCILPILMLAYTSLYSMIFEYLPVEQTAEFMPPPFPGILMSLVASMPIGLFYALLAVSVIIYGPATCGLTYVLRNWARQEHSWISDFFVKMKENFKQGLAVGIIEVLVYSALVLNLRLAVSDQAASSEGMRAMLSLARYASVIIAVFFTFMRHYLYMMVVTFKLSIRQILKNAWIFSVLGFFRNILVTVTIIVLAGVLLLFGSWFELILMPIFMFAFWGFLTVFTCYPVIRKYMIDAPAKAALEEENGGGEGEYDDEREDTN